MSTILVFLFLVLFDY
jgi:hypothetical protein